MKRRKHIIDPALYYGEVRKTINMPPALWRQIASRLAEYEPQLDFADWARRIFQAELKRPATMLPDYLAQPKEPAREENPKRVSNVQKTAVMAALDRESDRVAIEAAVGNETDFRSAVRKLIGVVQAHLDDSAPSK